MPITDLRRADLENLPSREGITEFSSANLEVKDWERTRVEPLIEDYPFEQDSFKASLTYEEQSGYTTGRSVDIALEYRTQSELLLLNLSTDLSSLTPVFSELSDAAGGSDRIYHNLHAPEDRLWSFIEQADRVLDIHVLDEGTEISYKEVEDASREDVIGEYAIESAEIGFNYGDHQILVSYDSGRLQIETDWNEGTEYILQLFEREVLGEK